MAKYEEIKGTGVEFLSSDPSDPAEGQIWYNTSTKKLKGNQILNMVFRTAQSLPPAGGYLYNAANGYVATNAPFAGYNGVATVIGGTPLENTQMINWQASGQDWTSSATFPNYRYALSGAGGYESGVWFGGTINGTTALGTTDIQSLNSFTSNPTGLNTARMFLGGSGASGTSSVAYGGSPAVDTSTTATENWNGSNWTNNPTGLNTSRTAFGSSGESVTTSLAFGGQGFPSPGSPVVLNSTESFNGSTWTSFPNLNTTRQRLSGHGNYTASVAAGGLPPSGTPQVTNEVERWNGTTWTVNGSGMIFNKYGFSAMGDGSTSGVIAGGAHNFPDGNWNAETYTAGPSIIEFNY